MPIHLPSWGQDRIYALLLYANAVMFGLCLLMDPFHVNVTWNPFQFLTPSDRVLVMMGATGTLPIDRLHRWWSLLTANYLHGSLVHLLFNMAALRQLVSLVVDAFGPARMIVIFTFSGIIGFLVSYFAGIVLTIGASAGLCGLMGACMSLALQVGGDGGRLLLRQIGAWAIGIFVFGLLVPGINNWGHAGGMAGGYLLAWLTGHRMQRSESAIETGFAWICIVLTAVTLFYAVISTLLYRLGD